MHRHVFLHQNWMVQLQRPGACAVALCAPLLPVYCSLFPFRLRQDVRRDHLLKRQRIDVHQWPVAATCVPTGCCRLLLQHELRNCETALSMFSRCCKGPSISLLRCSRGYRLRVSAGRCAGNRVFCPEPCVRPDGRPDASKT